MKDMLLQFLKKTGKKDEFKIFLDLFQNLPGKQFALIKISGETLDNHLETIARDIAFLNKLGLYPMIIHGGGSRLDRVLASTQKIDGLRVTPEGDMEVIRTVFSDIGNLLKDKIIEMGGRAAVVRDAVEADFLERAKYGHVGKIVNIDLAVINSCLESGCTPIISPLGRCTRNAGLYLNINADTVARELVTGTGVGKMIFLTETGGVLNAEGAIIPSLNLQSDEECGFIKGGMLVKVNEIRDFLRQNSTTDVVITSAANLLQEIFTVSGNGTFFKNHAVEFSDNTAATDRVRLKKLLEHSFARELKADYFEQPIKGVLYQKDYEAAAIISEVNRIPYLCKFAVAGYRQGTGLGKALWQDLTVRYPRLIWRTKTTNKANRFYFSRCSGMVSRGQWNIYWRNLQEEEIFPAVTEVLKKGESFGDPINICNQL